MGSTTGASSATCGCGPFTSRRRRRAGRRSRRSSSRRPSRGWFRPRPGTCRTIGALLIKPLRVASGSPVDSARAAAARLGLIDRWMRDLHAHAWWRQAAAARALGLVRAEGALQPLLALPRRSASRRSAPPPSRRSATSAIRAACRRCCGRCPTPRATSGPASSSRSASWGRAWRTRSSRTPGPSRRSGDRRRADRLHRRGERRRRPAGVVEPRRPPGAGGGAAGAGLARARRPRLLLRAARAR